MRLILIAGQSGAGKSHLANALAIALPSSATIALDSYYHPLEHLTLDERGRQNFDHPDALDWPLLESQIAALRGGQSIRVPVYLFDIHTRGIDRQPILPPDFLILEGIHALHRAELRAQAALRIFVTADEEMWLTRRLERDQAERGRSRESVMLQVEATVKPMAREFLYPTQRYADLTIAGDAPVGRSIEEIVKRLGVAS